MKKNTHPDYQDIMFIDTSTGTRFICGSTLKTKETELFEGKTYPVCRVAISSASHPFFTKANQFLDTEGRVDKFRKRYAKKQEEKPQEEENKQPAKKTVARKAVAPKKTVKKK